MLHEENSKNEIEPVLPDNSLRTALRIMLGMEGNANEVETETIQVKNVSKKTNTKEEPEIIRKARDFRMKFEEITGGEE